MKMPIKPQGCTHLKVRQLDRLLTRHYDRLLAQAGLKNTQYSLLSHVAHLGPLRPGELARHLQMDASTLTRNLQPLVAQGWLTLSAGEDARSRRVDITSTGRAKQQEGRRAWKEAQLALNARLGTEQVAALHDLLQACQQALQDSPPTSTD